MTRAWTLASRARAGIGLVVSLLIPGPLRGQPVETGADSVPTLGPVRWDLGLSAIGARPVGEFADYVDFGSGFSLLGALRLHRHPSLSVRIELELISYGSTTREIPLNPAVPVGNVSLITENAIGSLTLGPELVLGDGLLRPYLSASVGSSQFVTTTSVWESGKAFPVASTEDLEDFTYALAGGGGLRIVMADERLHPFALDVGARYVRHGLTTYLREGGVRQSPSGDVLIDPTRSEANLITLHLGATVGLR